MGRPGSHGCGLFQRHPTLPAIGCERRPLGTDALGAGDALIQEALSQQSKRPMGFGCAQGDWELEGLNPCFRVNSYGPRGFLKPHRDAPFSPDLNVRSLCTLLIPLSSAGRTRFFYPLQALDSRGMTLEEELKARGGLDSGFRALDVRLAAGAALLFGQSLLHEGIPADGQGHKMLLRTDARASA